MAKFTKEEAIRLPGEGECGMNETRSESYKNVEHLLREDPRWSNMDATVCFLSEIAGSLAVIADCMTAKKEGDAE